MRRKNSQGESNDHKSACVRDSVWCACPAEKQGEGQKEEKRKWKLLHMFFWGGGYVLHLTTSILMLIKMYITNLLFKNVKLLFDAF